MGYGCNAAGVTGARIINSPRERLLAILTNVFTPCNGRFPLYITLSTVFLGGFFAGGGPSAAKLAALLGVMGIVLLGIAVTFLVNWALSKTLLKGETSFFAMELPPYRKPQIVKTLIHSLVERTMKVLQRAVVVAIPAGVVIWLMANIPADGVSLLLQAGTFLDPFARLMGLDGVILLAFILAFPANEIVLPIIIMSYMSTSAMLELSDLTQLHALLTQNGWTLITAVNVMLFSLMHFPCGTTLLTIKRETKSAKWTAIAFALPTLLGIAATMTVTALWRLFT